MLRCSALDHEIKKTIKIVSVALLVGFAVGCSTFRMRTTEDSSYLTPVSEQTLAAFRFDSPIQDKTRAVVAARLILTSTRLRSQREPVVTLVQELSLAEARRQVAQVGFEDRPADARVWLVVFKAEWQVFPPDPMHTVTPGPASEGCVFVLMDASDRGRSQVGSTECAR